MGLFDEQEKPKFEIGKEILTKNPELAKILPAEKTEQEKKIEATHKADVDANKIRVPDIYFWVDYNLMEKPVAMTCAFKWISPKFGLMLFGETQKIEPEWSKSKRRAYEKQLMRKMVESLGLIVHMGDSILDLEGNIHPEKANDEIARRYYLDRLWKARMDAFHKVVRVKAINVVKARELHLL